MVLAECVEHGGSVGRRVAPHLLTRLLVRLGADEDAVALRRALAQAGKPSPLSATQLAVLGDRVGEGRFDGLSGAEAFVRARAALARYD